jgi:succinate dehydrogenase/fumarate reductase flavoprotein subunit
MIRVEGISMGFHHCNTLIVGSGAAGLSAAGHLHKMGQKDIAILTEGLTLGTSRNTGSDKQTYYRLTVSGDQEDSVARMARTLFSGGAMDGDIALCEAASSVRCFYRLVELGVPFPHDRFGEYAGYKTDHDPCRRGSSAGPLTSKYMTECLLRDVREREIRVFDGFQVVEILTTEEDIDKGGERDKGDKKAVGLLALNLNALEDPDSRYLLISATNIVYATGGEAGMYKTSVYPESQTGGTGIALRARAWGKNLTESQYGIASVKFRWNLSGSYQQVIPRYVSTDPDGRDPQEFLDPHFDSVQKMLEAIFLKGYQWPFDPRKISGGGSSTIDLLVYQETEVKKRRVFLDFTRNPSRGEENGALDFDTLSAEAREYLTQSGALQKTPIERLSHMNQPAVDLYAQQGIDLRGELLEIAVCAQHNNGGLAGNIWWESNLKHFFPIGEVNGTHGVYRPGGSALNSGQVGALRASQYIARRCSQQPLNAEELLERCHDRICEVILEDERWLRNGLPAADTVADRALLGERMSRAGAIIRSLGEVRSSIREAVEQKRKIERESGVTGARELPSMRRNRDLLVSQIAYLGAIEDYIVRGGESRGSYLVCREDGLLDSGFRFNLEGGRLSGEIQEAEYRDEGCLFHWREVRPVPSVDPWFENVWKEYLQDNAIR